MTDAVRVSFVVPCYNYARYLPDCLDSIFAQDGTSDFEVIAIDDASTDGTLDVLARYNDPRLRVLRHEKNRGHVATITEGLHAARGEFVARIDPDDRYRPYFLSEVLPRFARHRDVALVYGDAAMIDADGRLNAAATDRVHGGAEFTGSEFIPLLMQNFICAPTVIARRAAWLEALPVPPNLAFNDWYFNLMIARRHPFHFTPRVLAEYRVHAVNHHTLIVRNRSEEPSIRLLLDTIFGQTEIDPKLERRKRAVRGRAYAAQYLTLANKYFGNWMAGDARRCYLEAVRNYPLHLLSPTILRRLAATWLDERTYVRLKRLVGRSPA
jgi:glycosyltransferase involved in cell wall biosynthesis